MNNPLQDFVHFVGDRDGSNDKSALAQEVAVKFGLTKDRKVFYCADFAVRFSASASVNFANTVLSLSNLKKVDDRPFVVCLVTPTSNHCFLANTTLLKKISHSSQELRENNIKETSTGQTSSGALKASRITPPIWRDCLRYTPGLALMETWCA